MSMKILDFGTDGEGLPGADWVQEGEETATPYGNTIWNVWVGKPCEKCGGTGKRPDGNRCWPCDETGKTRLPLNGPVYDVIHCRYAMTHNYFNEWRFILSEMKRVLKSGGFLHFLESNTIDEEDGYKPENVDRLFHEVFSADEGFTVHLNMQVVDGELGFTCYVWHDGREK